MRKGGVGHHDGLSGEAISLPRRVVRFHELGAETGVRVANIEPGSPADLAGLKIGDVIVELDNEPIVSVDVLLRMLTAHRIGAASSVTVIRMLEMLTLKLVPAQRPQLAA